MDSVWHVVEAVNNYPQFQITLPLHQLGKIVAGFEKASYVGFNVCTGAVDGILIWMQKPNVNEAKRVGVDQSQRKFLCGRKHKFGLNCQAVANFNGKILGISIVYGTSAADCVATFEASDLNARDLKTTYYNKMGTSFVATMPI
ncbi:LOW QUALITY PROTEIN: hypothetical protein ACHAW5_010937 [Stephanodiscus triporus]|uniref:Uncharacterized protein n=1 Tax=Stephanodiscus triporus TaxID=2934178 RepID=A0ABD3QZE0_9STRA